MNSWRGAEALKTQDTDYNFYRLSISSSLLTLHGRLH